MRRLAAILIAGTIATSSACSDSAAPVSADAGLGFGDAEASPDGGAPGGSLPDAGAPVSIQDECDPVEQTGCAAPATKCVVEGPAAGAECVAPGADELPLGSRCVGQDCAPGLACARLTSTSSTSACVKVCDLGTGAGCDGLGESFECRTRLTGTNWGACAELSPVCEPLSQTPCPDEEACQPFLRRTGTWEFRCRGAGPGAEGVACGPARAEACARGLACVSDPQGDAYCRKICGSDEDCPSPEQCNGVVSTPPFMYCSS